MCLVVRCPSDRVRELGEREFKLGREKKSGGERERGSGGERGRREVGRVRERREVGEREREKGSGGK
jgi:hypothetical protein